MAHKAWCYNSTGRWQAFPKINLYGDIPRIVLKAIM